MTVELPRSIPTGVELSQAVTKLWCRLRGCPTTASPPDTLEAPLLVDNSLADSKLEESHIAVVAGPPGLGA